MTQDEIIEMTRSLGICELTSKPKQSIHYSLTIHAMEAFAKLVAAKEREACARICENYADTDSYQDETSGGTTTDFHAKLIRARGEA